MQPQTIGAPIHYRRAHKRFDYAVPCTVVIGAQCFSATTRNVSGGGVNLRLDGDISIASGKTVVLAIEDFEPVGMVVRWSQGPVHGFQFLRSVGNLPRLGELIADLELSASLGVD